MDKQTSEKLKLFISQANVDHLHPLDEKLFYDFMLSAFKQWEYFDPYRARRLLIEGGFREKKAIDLVEFCGRGKDFLDYIKERGKGLSSI